MLFIFSTPVLIRHLRQLKAVVFPAWVSNMCCSIANTSMLPRYYPLIVRLNVNILSIITLFIVMLNAVKLRVIRLTIVKQIVIMMSTIMLTIVIFKCPYAECHRAECCYSECVYSLSRLAECH